MQSYDDQLENLSNQYETLTSAMQERRFGFLEYIKAVETLLAITKEVRDIKHAIRFDH